MDKNNMIGRSYRKSGAHTLSLWGSATIASLLLSVSCTTKPAQLRQELKEPRAIPQQVANAESIRVDSFISYDQLVPNQGDGQNQTKNELKVWSVTETQDSAFIKVNFKLNLKDGDYIKVCNPARSECYRYPDGEGYTPAADGSIWALSIDGPKLEISLFEHTPGDKAIKDAEGRRYGVEIIQYTRGFGDQELNDQLSAAPTAICGKKDFVNIECAKSADPAKFKMKTGIARFQRGLFSCTTWLVKNKAGTKDMMMTNHHCVPQADEIPTTESIFVYETVECTGTKEKKFFKVAGDKMILSDRDLDFALYRIHGGEKTKDRVAFEVDATYHKVGFPIYLIHHPMGGPMQITTKDDKNPNGGCQVDDYRYDDYSYYCDTQSGSSGAPVLSQKNPHKVVALHHYGGCHNSGVTMKDIKPKITEWVD